MDAVAPSRENDRPEAASLQVLETIIVVSLMLSALVFVATFEAPPAGGAPVREQVSQQARDALDILGETYLSDGSDALSAYSLECLQGSCSNLTRKLDRILPQGASYALYMSNGGRLYPVLENESPPGEAVSVQRFLEPAWSHTFVSTAVDTLNPSEDALTVFSLPIHKSSALGPGGSPLLVRVYGTRVVDGSDYVLGASGSTLAYDVSDAASMPAVSLAFVDEAGQTLPTLDATATTLVAGLAPSGTPVTLRLRVDETAGVPLADGATIRLQVPRGWTARAPAELNPDWEVLANATDKHGSATGAAVEARLVAPLAGGSRDLLVQATYLGDQIDRYPFQAALSRGASASASLLVRADAKGSQPTLETASVHLTAPRPMGATATTRWAVAAAVPDGGLGTPYAVDVTRVEVVEADGAPIFGSVAGVLGGGTWTNEGDRLVWTGVHRITHAAPLGLAFNVTASGVAGSHHTRPLDAPSATFEGWSSPLGLERAPGLFQGVFLPAANGYMGYNGSTDALVTKDHVLRSDAMFRSTLLPGAATYTVGSFTSVRDAVQGSFIAPQQRHVPVGTSTTLEVNVQSAFYHLVALGFEPDVTMRVYPPWTKSPATGTPLLEETLLGGGSLGTGALEQLLDPDSDGNFEASDHGRWAPQLDVPEHWLFGTYVVEVELSWFETVSGLVDGTPTSVPVPRSARLYDYFVVTPPDALMPPSPVYDVHLVVWMPDWQ